MAALARQTGLKYTVAHMKRLIAAAAASSLLLPFAALAAPMVGTVTPGTATANIAVTMSVSVSSGTPIQSCNLYIDLEDAGQMTINGNTASKSYTFAFGGSHIAFVFCRDTGGGLANGPNTAIWVEGPLQNTPPFPNPTPTPTPTPSPTPGPNTIPSRARTLIKLVCPAGADVDHPCKAVYYIGVDGKRHAFPNSKVFFTWYGNFDSVEEVPDAELTAFPLGLNVTYRPGVRMVKFTTLDKVYAVSAGGVLRWIGTEAVARALYGDDWNTKIDDIADTFFTNYSFGADIMSATEFNPTLETSTKVTFD